MAVSSRQGDKNKALISRYIMEIVSREIKNPKIGLVSVNEVTLNRDSSLAKVYVTFFNAKYSHQAFLELKKEEGLVRTLLSKKVPFYKVPKIEFVYDESFERAASLEEALKREEDSLKK